jgi:hypothetical protein
MHIVPFIKGDPPSRSRLPQLDLAPTVFTHLVEGITHFSINPASARNRLGWRFVAARFT